MREIGIVIGGKQVGGPGPQSGPACTKELKQMSNFLKRFADNESGATAIEYGLIAALMAVAIIAAVGALSPKLKDAFTTIGGKMAVS
jgi:pilus assembly protein Flp/PilA